MKRIIPFFVLLFLLSCGNSQKSKIVDHKTIQALDSLKDNDTVYFKSPDGKTYLVTKMVQALEEDYDSIKNNDTTQVRRLTATSNTGDVPCTSENFDGSDRKKAKLSFSSATEETFTNLAALVATLPSDQSMGTLVPPITTGATSDRVKEEKRNVHVLHTYIFAFSREGDEDYHVIIGTTNNKNTAEFFNAEISGLPPSSSSSYTIIKNVRKKFKDHFGLNNSCQGGYVTTFINKPVEVELKGSLFFDELHYLHHTNIGTSTIVPKSYWEIHPIKDIVFL